MSVKQHLPGVCLTTSIMHVMAVRSVSCQDFHGNLNDTLGLQLGKWCFDYTGGPQ